VKALLLAVLTFLLASPARALDSRHLALVVNTDDPLSVQIGEYYAAQRRLLFSNVVRVSFPAGQSALSVADFIGLKAKVEEQTSSQIQAYALAWTEPYRVECMSVTSAFAFGFDLAYCADGCKPTHVNPYFDSRSRLPFTQHRMRPAMALAASSFDEAKALIDRGVRADGSWPAGTAYFLSTSDRNRNVRAATYPLAERILGRRLAARTLKQDTLIDAKDVFFYFTGLSHVDNLDTLAFLPGAVADHMTSSGGHLTGGGQMSALRWLEAGATGSYGAVVEPCNLSEKFPNPAVLAKHYLAGDTLIEAYWKSVAMPGQGIFIGEPLAAPFRKPAARR
jgi:uncharacterized protein (TIGR03790 family)